MFLLRLIWILPTQIANSASSNASVVDDSDHSANEDSAAEESATEDSAALDSATEESLMVQHRCCVERLPLNNRVQGDEVRLGVSRSTKIDQVINFKCLGPDRRIDTKWLNFRVRQNAF